MESREDPLHDRLLILKYKVLGNCDYRRYKKVSLDGRSGSSRIIIVTKRVEFQYELRQVSTITMNEFGAFWKLPGGSNIHKGAAVKITLHAVRAIVSGIRGLVEETSGGFEFLKSNRL